MICPGAGEIHNAVGQAYQDNFVTRQASQTAPSGGDVIEEIKKYKENIDIIFDGLNSILESMIKEESVSLEEIEQLKLGIEKIKNNLNKPTNE